MKKMLIIIFSLSAIFGTATNKEYKKLVKENSWNAVYPKVIIKDGDPADLGYLEMRKQILSI